MSYSEFNTPISAAWSANSPVSVVTIGPPWRFLEEMLMPHRYSDRRLSSGPRMRTR